VAPSRARAVDVCGRRSPAKDGYGSPEAFSRYPAAPHRAPRDGRHPTVGDYVRCGPRSPQDRHERRGTAGPRLAPPPTRSFAARTGVKDHRLGGPASGSPPPGFGSGVHEIVAGGGQKHQPRRLGTSLRPVQAAGGAEPDGTGPDLLPSNHRRAELDTESRRRVLDGAPLVVCDTVERRREAWA